MNAEELAQRVIQCLAVQYGIQPNQLLAAMRDGASVNEAGLPNILPQYSQCHLFLPHN